MLRISQKDLTTLVLSVSLVIGAVLTSGCVGNGTETPPQETPTQIIESITPQEAFNLILENQDNPDFVIIDVRTLGEFNYGHIENAINIDFRSETFRGEINQLDKNKTYLIYSVVGERSRNALDIMEGLNFREVYNLWGGIIQWQARGFPISQGTATQIIENITPQEAFNLIQENQHNPDFVIIDVRTPEEFAEGHIENAINIDFLSVTFKDEISELDKDKTYLIYYTCQCGNVNRKVLKVMVELNFGEVYNIGDGLDGWKAEGLPTVK